MERENYEIPLKQPPKKKGCNFELKQKFDQMIAWKMAFGATLVFKLLQKNQV